jgi:microcystin-dependent protein
MSEQYLGEIRIFSFGFAPKGWAMCNGQLLPINQNQALFSVLGTTYGGDGRLTFALPNLQGRIPVDVGAAFTLGQPGGETTHALSLSELPAHTHVPAASDAVADLGTPAGNVWAQQAYAAYAASANAAMSPATILSTGGGQPHGNMSPFLVLNICIALQGIYPSQ